MSAPWFFDRLGIAPVRDAKQIKRAYALALKAIDQQAEREAFETLRKAYEAALAWAREPGYENDYLAPDRAADVVARPVPEVPSEPEPDATAGPVPPAADMASQDAADTGSAPRQDVSLPVTPHVAPDAQSIDPRPDDPVDAERGREPVGHTDVPPAPRPAASTVISNESYGASRVAIRQWVGRLLKPQQTPLEEIFDQALNDPRLTHLDSRVQLEAQLVEALHKDPAGRACLFKLATDRFGWAERNARPAGTSYQAEWVYGAVNQQLSWEMQPAEVLTAQRVAIDAAIATATPTRRQAFEHAAALQAFSDGFPGWAELVLPAGRVDIWREAYDNLSDGWLRAARLRKRYPRNFSQFVATLILLIVVGSIVYGMLKPSRVNTPGNAPTSQTNAGAGKPPAVEAPVLAYEIMGPVTKDSCETTHEFVHQSNWLEVDDPDAIALLSTRAMLCQDRKLWPQARDPLIDCLRAERGAAFTAGRQEAPGACAANRDAAKPAAGRG